MTRKLDDTAVTEIRDFLAQGCTRKDLAWLYEVSSSTIRLIEKGESHTGRSVARRNDRKYTDDDVRFIRKLAIDEGLYPKEIDRRLRETRGKGVKNGTLYQMLNGKTYRDVV